MAEYQAASAAFRGGRLHVAFQLWTFRPSSACTRPLDSRMRTRLTMAPASREELLDALAHGLESVGHANLMTDELMRALVEHAAGNYRVLIMLARDVLELG